MLSTCANAWRNRDLPFSSCGEEARDRASRKMHISQEGDPHQKRLGGTGMDYWPADVQYGLTVVGPRSRSPRVLGG
jgi:hypothetical protein